jgi:hypothetical protein
MIHPKNACTKCSVNPPVPTTVICAGCLRREALDQMMLGWALLRPVERETFMRRAGVGRTG